MDHKEILKVVQSELKDIDNDKIDFVIKHFWKQLRYYLTHPLEAGNDGIRIEKFIKFYMSEKNIKEKLRTAKIFKSCEIVDFYEKLYNKVKNKKHLKRRKKNESR